MSYSTAASFCTAPKQTPAPAGLFPCLSKEEINLLPIQAWEGPVVIVRDEETLAQTLSALQKEEVLGFDTETRPTFIKGKSSSPALIQLATATTAYIIQLIHLPFGAGMAKLLSCPSILKVGVAIHNDMKALARVHPFMAGGVVDLADMAKERGIQAQGLRTLAANLLGFRISKSAKCSNWENHNLTPQQIKYAATDAWLGNALYFRMLHMGKHGCENALPMGR